MSKLPVFGCDELKKCLVILGFTIDENRGKGGHALAKHETKKPVEGQAPYITVRGLKEYADAGFRSMIVNEIIRFGFTRDEIIDALSGKRKK